MAIDFISVDTAFLNVLFMKAVPIFFSIIFPATFEIQFFILIGQTLFSVLFTALFREANCSKE